MNQAPDLLSFDSWDYDSSMTASRSVASDLESTAETVSILVSGAPFQIDSFVFSKLEKLPWKWMGDLGDGSNGVYHLAIAPQHFEILLHHLLFGSFPYHLCATDRAEVRTLAAMAGLNDLIQHLALPAGESRSRGFFPARRRVDSTTVAVTAATVTSVEKSSKPTTRPRVSDMKRKLFGKAMSHADVVAQSDAVQ